MLASASYAAENIEHKTDDCNATLRQVQCYNKSGKLTYSF